MQHVGVGEHEVRARAGSRRAPRAACRRRRCAGRTAPREPERADRARLVLGERLGRVEVERARPGGRGRATSSVGRLKHSDLPEAVPVVTIVGPCQAASSGAAPGGSYRRSIPALRSASTSSAGCSCGGSSAPARRAGVLEGLADEPLIRRGPRRATRPMARSRASSSPLALTGCHSRGGCPTTLRPAGSEPAASTIRVTTRRFVAAHEGSSVGLPAGAQLRRDRRPDRRGARRAARARRDRPARRDRRRLGRRHREDRRRGRRDGVLGVGADARATVRWRARATRCGARSAFSTAIWSASSTPTCSSSRRTTRSGCSVR